MYFDLKPSINSMKNFISIFEIPATDISRAIDFYQVILDIKIEEMNFPGMQMGLFPSEGQATFGVIIQGEGYKPSPDGVTVYLDGGDNLQVGLDKVEKHGGKIVIPKTPLPDESGYFASFIDTEGNGLGLYSPNWIEVRAANGPYSTPKHRIEKRVLDR